MKYEILERGMVLCLLAVQALLFVGVVAAVLA